MKEHGKVRRTETESFVNVLRVYSQGVQIQPVRMGIANCSTSPYGDWNRRERRIFSDNHLQQVLYSQRDMRVGPDRVRVVSDEPGAYQHEHFIRDLFRAQVHFQADRRSWYGNTDGVDRIGQVGVFDHVSPIQQLARLALRSLRASRSPSAGPEHRYQNGHSQNGLEHEPSTATHVTWWPPQCLLRPGSRNGSPTTRNPLPAPRPPALIPGPSAARRGPKLGTGCRQAVGRLQGGSAGFRALCWPDTMGAEVAAYMKRLYDQGGRGAMQKCRFADSRLRQLHRAH